LQISVVVVVAAAATTTTTTTTVTFSFCCLFFFAAITPASLKVLKEYMWIIGVRFYRPNVLLVTHVRALLEYYLNDNHHYSLQLKLGKYIS